jgi:DNA processing protein
MKKDLIYKSVFAQSFCINLEIYQKIKKTYQNFEEAYFNIDKNFFKNLNIKPEKIDYLINFLKNNKPEQVYEKLSFNKIKIIELNDSNYPKLLKKISFPPVFLYYKGNLSEDNFFGVVGTRKMSPYGYRSLKKILPDLLPYFNIVSGLAYGIDISAHKLCLENKSKTTAVLANGLDTVYPSLHKKYTEEILANNGLILSETPPETEIKPYFFPLRNRIIAGLSQGVLIVEGKKKSGSLITAQIALEENREIFAIPGNILTPNQTGTNFLIKTGSAKCVTESKDILEEFNINQTMSLFENKELDPLSKLIPETGISQENLLVKTNLNILKLNEKLSLLELNDEIEKIGMLYYPK